MSVIRYRALDVRLIPLRLESNLNNMYKAGNVCMKVTLRRLRTTIADVEKAISIQYCECMCLCVTASVV